MQNPVHALTEVLSTFRDQEGTIAIEGFYDNVRPLSGEERKAYAALGFDEEEVKKRQAFRSCSARKDLPSLNALGLVQR